MRLPQGKRTLGEVIYHIRLVLKASQSMTHQQQPKQDATQVRDELLRLSHRIGSAEQMAILGEGNVSGRIDENSFWIKASGTELGSLTANQLVEVKFAPILEALAAGEAEDDEIEAILLASRVDAHALKPSVETLFHALLLQLPGVSFVGHTHAICVNQLLCSPRAKEFAERRLFPDQIVYCGAESVLVPYVDPGIVLATRIDEELTKFVNKWKVTPKTILMENHGLIALGATAKQVEASLLMAEKSARVFVGAVSSGGPLFMDQQQVQRIASRSDEHYRQKMIEGK